MTVALIILAFAVIAGVPIILFGFMRIEEGQRSGWIILLVGFAVILGPIGTAVVLHQETSGLGRYIGR